MLEAVGKPHRDHVLLTHGHDDHIKAVRQFVDRLGGETPVLMSHRGPRAVACRYTRRPGFRSRSPMVSSSSRDRWRSPCWPRPGTLRFCHLPCSGPRDHGVLFTSDTLFQGEPGATGRSYSDFPTIIESIDEHPAGLPEGTLVLPGHGDSTTIGSEKPHLPSGWRAVA
ncbi:MBL fold metallo-hydrolase [Kocuria rhizophila]|nr:MBL fold metallo-hydrolase [Kocuria rhizophila]